ncbi:hypothetical protein [Leucobacter celer]|uniref:hypothetical protein n=1 Tax=Leucobacter celer TaxID=668625 RepID=UPI0006A7793A|nr:hypothetical protein [Leucobacter celer]
MPVWLGWVVVVVVLGAIFGLPPLMRYVEAPPISESFGIEDAVVALRLEARDTPYLVLVNEAGQTRSARVEERGFEHSRIAWSEAGLSTGDRGHEYLLGESGLVEMPLPASKEARSERERLVTDSGFTVLNGSAEGQEAVFVDAASGESSLVDIGYVNPEWAACGGEVVAVRESAVQTVTPSTRDFDGLGMFDGIESLACDAGRAYGLSEISDRGASRQALRVWDRATDGVGAFEVRYPEVVRGWRSSSLFAREGRLYWAVDQQLWSVRPPASGGRDPRAEGELPVVEAGPVVELGGRIGDYYPVVGTDEGLLAPEAGRLYGVAVDEEWVKRSKGRSYDRLDGLAIFSVDAATGERRLEIEIDDIDFPRRDLRVTAIAVDPGWATGR